MGDVRAVRAVGGARRAVYGAAAVERRGVKRCSANAVVAAVVGVIAHLGLWLAARTILPGTRAVRWGWLRLDLPTFDRIELAPLVIAARRGRHGVPLKWGGVGA